MPAGADFFFFYEHSMLDLVHRWWKCTDNSDYVEKVAFCSSKFALPSGAIALFVYVAVSIEKSRKHYFKSNLHFIPHARRPEKASSEQMKTDEQHSTHAHWREIPQMSALSF